MPPEDEYDGREVLKSIERKRVGLGYSWGQALVVCRERLNMDMQDSIRDPPYELDSGQAFVERKMRSVLSGLDIPEDKDEVYLSESEVEGRIEEAKKEGYENAVSDLEASIPTSVDEAVLEEAICRRCQQADAQSMHHIIPRSFGGDDRFKNKIPLCSRCHDEVEILTERYIQRKGKPTIRTMRDYIESGFPLSTHEVGHARS